METLEDARNLADEARYQSDFLDDESFIIKYYNFYIKF